MISTTSTSVGQLARRAVTRYPPMLVGLSALVVLLALIPLLFVIGYTLSAGWDSIHELIFRQRVAELLRNTTVLVVTSTVACLVLGVGAAWLVERTTLPGRRVWNLLLAAPLAVPAFVNSFGWVSITHAVEGFGGALLIVTLSYYPLVYLPAAAMLRGLDPALEETARALGHGPWRTFARVVLPQLRPAMLGGGLLVGLHLLSEFGALQLLRFQTFTTAIYDQYQSSFNGPAANALASVLVVCCVVLLTAELGLRGRAAYSRIGSGAPRRPELHRLGRWQALALLATTALVGLALGVPMLSLLRWLLVGHSTAFPVAALLGATATSVGLAAVAAGVTTALALPVGWLVVRHRSRVATLLERSTYFGNALPGIVVALSLVTVSLHVAPGVYQTVWLLIAAYAIIALPRALISVKAAMLQAPPVFSDVSSALGSSSLRTFRRVTLPLISPGLGAGAALVFLAVVTELTATLLLAPIGTNTLSTRFWSSASSLAYGAAAPYAALMVAISLPATFLLTRQLRSPRGDRAVEQAVAELVPLRSGPGGRG